MQMLTARCTNSNKPIQRLACQRGQDSLNPTARLPSQKLNVCQYTVTLFFRQLKRLTHGLYKVNLGPHC
jgi:hypothetical protein